VRLRGPGAYCGAPSVVVMSLFKLLTLARTPVRAYCAPIATRALRSVVTHAACCYTPHPWRGDAAYFYTKRGLARASSTRDVLHPRAYCGPEADAIFYCIRPT